MVAAERKGGERGEEMTMGESWMRGDEGCTRCTVCARAVHAMFGVGEEGWREGMVHVRGTAKRDKYTTGNLLCSSMVKIKS